eukprot:319584-Amphidinium_carterae.1
MKALVDAGIVHYVLVKAVERLCKGNIKMTFAWEKASLNRMAFSRESTLGHELAVNIFIFVQSTIAS